MQDNDTLQEVKWFMKWEQSSRDTIDVKRCYIDIAEDLVSGILLSQIVYWFLPNNEGSKLRIERNNKLWLAKGRTDWWDECRITERQFDRSISILKNKGIVETKLFKFNGTPVIHISLNIEILVQRVKSILTKGENGFYTKCKIHFDKSVKSLHTENTTETTTKNNIINATKKTYGEFSNVRLTDEEHAKLVERFNSHLTELIEKLSAYKASTGRTYKSDYATILNWERRESTFSGNNYNKSKGGNNAKQGMSGNNPTGAFSDLD